MSSGSEVARLRASLVAIRNQIGAIERTDAKTQDILEGIDWLLWDALDRSCPGSAYTQMMPQRFIEFLQHIVEDGTWQYDDGEPMTGEAELFLSMLGIES